MRHAPLLLFLLSIAASCSAAPLLSVRNLLRSTTTYDFFAATPQCASLVVDSATTSPCNLNTIQTALAVLQYRRCSAKLTAATQPLSISALASCEEASLGCAMSLVDSVFSAINFAGIPTAACYPEEDLTQLSVSSTCGEPWLKKQCVDKSQFELIKCGDGYQVNAFFGKESKMRDELVKNGPFAVQLAAPADLRTAYTGGVWTTKKVDNEVDLMATVVGFGVDGNNKYWTLQMNFGSSFGEKGFMRIQRGNNVLGVESFVTAVHPNPPKQIEQDEQKKQRLVLRSADDDSADANELVIDQRLIAKINADSSMTWKAGRNAIFEGKTKREFRQMLGVRSDPSYKPVAAPRDSLSAQVAAAIPAAFDARERWPQCIHPIRNQGQCGSCWAVSAAEVLTDRFCIGSNKSEDIVMSPQEMVDCASAGCQGGILSDAWTYMQHHGVVPDTCIPYTATDASCPDTNATCTDGSKFSSVFHAQSAFGMGNEQLMQLAILRNGPIQAAFSVDESFNAYKSGVFNACGAIEGKHAIKIVGWGVTATDSQKYWIIANSWGSDWGLDGYFLYARGDDLCGMESEAYTGLPVLA